MVNASRCGIKSNVEQIEVRESEYCGRNENDGESV